MSRRIRAEAFHQVPARNTLGDGLAQQSRCEDDRSSVGNGKMCCIEGSGKVLMACRQRSSCAFGPMMSRGESDARCLSACTTHSAAYSMGTRSMGTRSMMKRGGLGSCSGLKGKDLRDSRLVCCPLGVEGKEFIARMPPVVRETSAVESRSRRFARNQTHRRCVPGRSLVKQGQSWRMLRQQRPSFLRTGAC